MVVSTVVWWDGWRVVGMGWNGLCVVMVEGRAGGMRYDAEHHYKHKFG